ncbi:MAG TPA: hypothetical protein PKH29_12475, partial [Oscillospiraceae bacterium]|nr:hypothetical protein [Oscillospiraceae bacterium]
MANQKPAYLIPQGQDANYYPTAEDLEKAKKSRFIYDSDMSINPKINRLPDYSAPVETGYVYDPKMAVNPKINRTPDYVTPQSSGYIYDQNVTINPKINRTPDYGVGQSVGQSAGNVLIHGNTPGGLTGQTPYELSANQEGLNKPINGPGGVSPEYKTPTPAPSPTPTPAPSPTPTPAPSPTNTSVADRVAAILGGTGSGGSVADQIRNSAAAAAEAQKIQTQQAV